MNRQRNALLNQIPVTIITGFLGSGKTTLLSKLLRHPKMGQTAVIVNEFGEIGLDHELIESSDETDVTLMGGCLCCTVKSDLIDTMQRLYERRSSGDVPSFDRLVIETTGLADPAPVLQAIMADRILEQVYRLDGVVTLIDAVNGMKTLENHLEALKQAAVADRLVLTKTDVASSEDVDTLTKKLEQLNPTASVLEAAYGDVSPERLLDVGIFDPRRKSTDVERWINEEAFAHHHGEHGHDHHHHHEVNRHDDHISAFCIRHEEPIPSAAAGFFLDVLMAERGSDLLRIKGILNIAEVPSKPMVIHGVQHVIHTPAYLDAWPSDDHDSRLVFIVKDMTKESIENLLRVLLENRPYHEISDALPKKPSGNIETL